MGLYDTTIGPLLLGIFFNTYLYGLVTYQFAVYHRTKFGDQPAIRCMVIFLFILDTFHSASLIYLAWDYTVTNYDNPAGLVFAGWPHAFTPLGTALSALVTQIYLGFRIWHLSGSKFLYGVVILLAIPSFILGMTVSIKAWVIGVSSLFSRFIPVGVAWLTMQVVVDTFITATLVIIFTRSRTGFRKMDTILNRLIRGAIQTGLLAGIFSMCGLISMVVFLDTSFYIMFAIPIGRIYTITLMDTLLTRDSLKAEMDGTDHLSGGFSSLNWATAEPEGTVSTT